MIDLHTHTFFSDGELLPSELIRRAENIGYKTIAITDHADISNFEFLIENILKACKEAMKYWKINAFAGVEFTHVPPDSIKKLTVEARKKGAQVVVVHGETIVEPVPPMTNLRAIEAKVDILAHPGLIEEREVILSAKNGVCLEITTRKGHCYTNGHVAKLAKKNKAKLVLNTDTHSPDNLISYKQGVNIVKGAGLNEMDFKEMIKNSENIVKRRK